MMLLSLSSCKSDDKDTNFMYGTKWYARDSMYDWLFGTKDGPNYVVLDFSSKTEVEWYVVQNKQVKSVLSTLTYFCKEDNIVEIISEGGQKAIYSVKGKQMEKINDDGLRYETLMIYTD